MRIKRVLCPVDFSSCSNLALEHARKFAESHDATLVVAHATPLRGYSMATNCISSRPDPRLETMSIPDVSKPIHRVHLVGFAGEAIVDFADESDVDMIIMGTHGYSGFTRFLMGSVADYVLRHASCPVVVIRDPSRMQAKSSGALVEELPEPSYGAS